MRLSLRGKPMAHDPSNEGDEEDCAPQVILAKSSLNVTFQTEADEWHRPQNEYSTIARAASLFNASHCSFALSTPFYSHESEDAPKTFKIIPSQFLRLAERNIPRQPQPTASGFSQWIYSLYAKAYGDDDDRERGIALEQQLIDLRKHAAYSLDNSFLRSLGSDWRLIHSGLHVHGDYPIDYFNIRELPVNGSPLRASPDLVYQNWRRSEILIVEIKNSRLPITTNLWPNVWAQLWCYAQISQALNARKVTVVGEVWGEHWTGQGGGKWNPRRPVVYLRASVRRDPRAPAYDRFFRKLFDIYRGVS